MPSSALKFIQQNEDSLDCHYKYLFHLSLSGSNNPVPFECVAMTDSHAWLMAAEKGNRFNKPLTAVILIKKDALQHGRLTKDLAIKQLKRISQEDLTTAEQNILRLASK